MNNYCVYLIGEDEEYHITDYEVLVKTFEVKKEALEFAKNIDVLNQVLAKNPIKNEIKYVRMTVEEKTYEEEELEIYDIIFEKYLEWVKRRVNYKCRNCGSPLYHSQNTNYFAQCLKCEEDFYEFECIKK